MLAVVVQIDGWDPVGQVAVSLTAGSHDDPSLCHLNAQTWWPALVKLPTLRYDLFDGAFAGNIVAPSSSLTMRVEPWPDFGRYSLAGARIRLWVGELGAAWAAFTLRFDGRLSSQPAVADGQAQIDFAVDDSWLDTALLATYAGTTGAEGPAALKGQAKPLSIGRPRYVGGTLIDSVNSVFQVSDGSIQQIEAALERLARFAAPIADYPTHAALVAAVIPRGAWATAQAVGQARFGAPPQGQISFLVSGDNRGGWSRLPGAVIRRIAQIAGGAGRIADATFTALDAARPFPQSIYLDQQTTARELIQSIAAGVNAVVGMSWTGQLFVLPIAIGAATMTLAADGTSLPPVERVDQIEIATPWQKLTAAAERAWVVHPLSDIAFTAALVDFGPYQPTTTYREGNIVQAQNTSWLFIGPNPSSGNAPPLLPAISNTWWKALAPAVDAAGNSLAAGVAAARDAAQGAEANAASALAAISIIQSDGYLSAGEKAEIVRQFDVIASETPRIIAQAGALGVGGGAYQAAYDALVDYLTSLAPAWRDTTRDTPIVPATFNGKFADYYFARQTILNATAAKAATLANWDGVTGAGKDQLIAQAASTKTTADTAAANASSALSAISVIQSDGFLSAGEKAEVIRQFDVIAIETPTIIGQAGALGVGGAGYQAAYSALVDYLSALAPGWRDTTRDTPIVPATFNGKFADYYFARQAILNATAAKAATLANWDGVTGAGKDQLIAQAASTKTTADTAAANASSALSAISVIQSDGYLSAGEKAEIIRQFDTIAGETVRIITQAGALGVGGGVLQNAYNALVEYLTGLAPGWRDTTRDTPIVANTFNGKFTDYYYARQELLNATAAKAATLATWAGTTGVGKPADNATADMKLTPIGSATIVGNTIRSNRDVDGGDGGRTVERILGAVLTGCIVQGFGTYLKLAAANGQAYDCNIGGDGVVRTYRGPGRTDYGSIGNAALGDAFALVQDETKVTISKNGVLIFMSPDLPARQQTWLAEFTCFGFATIGGVYFRAATDNAWASTGGAGRPADNADVTKDQPIVGNLDPVTGRAKTSLVLTTSLLLGVRNTVSAVATASDQGSGSGVTISIPAHTRTVATATGPKTISFNAGSLTNRSYDVTYLVYVDDPNAVGGAVTYQSTTAPDDLLYTSRYHVTTITTPSNGGPATAGNAGAGSSATPQRASTGAPGSPGYNPNVQIP